MCRKHGYIHIYRVCDKTFRPPLSHCHCWQMNVKTNVKHTELMIDWRGTVFAKHKCINNLVSKNKPQPVFEFQMSPSLFPSVCILLKATRRCLFALVRNPFRVRVPESLTPAFSLDSRVVEDRRRRCWAEMTNLISCFIRVKIQIYTPLLWTGLRCVCGGWK